MDNDRLINLLPEEYLPEPEFKAFPIFATLLVILTILFIWLQYDTDSRKVRDAREALKQVNLRNDKHIVEAQQFVEVQANARFIRSYLAVIPTMVLQAPDYWEIYNEIEENLPEDTWVDTMRFRSGSREGWPELTVSFLSRGYSFTGPLQTYDKLLGTNEEPTRFRNLRMAGYNRTNVAGGPAAKFEIHMQVKYPLPEEKSE